MGQNLTFHCGLSSEELERFNKVCANRSEFLTNAMRFYKGGHKGKLGVIEAELEQLHAEIKKHKAQIFEKQKEALEAEKRLDEAKTKAVDYIDREKEAYINDLLYQTRREGKYMEIALEAKNKGFSSVEEYLGHKYENIREVN